MYFSSPEIVYICGASEISLFHQIDPWDKETEDGVCFDFTVRTIIINKAGKGIIDYRQGTH